MVACWPLPLATYGLFGDTGVWVARGAGVAVTTALAGDGDVGVIPLVGLLRAVGLVCGVFSTEEERPSPPDMGCLADVLADANKEIKRADMAITATTTRVKAMERTINSGRRFFCMVL